MTYDGIINLANTLLLQACDLLEAGRKSEARACRSAAQLLRDSGQMLIELENVSSGEVELFKSDKVYILNAEAWKQVSEDAGQRFADSADEWANRLYNRELALDYVRQVDPALWGAMTQEFVFMSDGWLPEAHYERGA